MIKKLRLRFIISALLSILFVLSATIAAINISNYIRTDREADRSLNMIVENEHLDRESGFAFLPQPREGDTRNREHYFIAVINADGEIAYCNTDHIFTVTDEEANELALIVYEKEETEGSITHLRYKKETITETYGGRDPITSVYISFIDVSERMNSFHDFLFNSIIVASISYLVIVALIIVSSHVVFKTSEESYRKQKAFITNASHELKTPLTIINTDVEILKMDDVNNEWTDSIEDQVRKLTAMTNQLVTLSKLDEESIKRNSFESLSLTEIANESITAFGPTFEKEGFKFSIDIDEGVAIKGNRNLLNELFYIFLDNAFKYTKANGEIVLKVKKNKYKIEINFENDIEDIEVDVNQVFERFYRSPHFSKKEGSGIGLSIAKEIVDLHKGKISASIKGQKIVFNILL